MGPGFDVSPPELPPEESITTPEARPLRHKIFDFTISIATGNVLSLGQGPSGFAGKLDYFRSQFKDLHLNFLGVQETRAAAGSSLQGGVLRLSSGADKGHGGVELWCNLAQPIAIHQGKGICLARNHFTVVCHDSRRLLVRIQHDIFEAWILVLVGYAPHSGYSMQERTHWWRTTQEMTAGFVEEQTPLFVCIGANTGPGEANGKHIFLPGFRTSSGSTLLKDFLADLQLCAPITSSIHVGSTCTWTSPLQEEFTIDYVLIPESWTARCSRSCIIEDFDVGSKVIDHAVHAVELNWQETRSISPSTGPPPLGFDRNCIQRQMPAAFTPFLMSPWSTDVEQHLCGSNDHLHAQLRNHCPRPRQGAALH